MVLWELTLATAYVLGLPRTYMLALRLQRRLIAPKHPKLRDFVYRRTRAVFSVAVNVHKEVQRRDISVGRNIGNRILRFLDRMRPQAQIRGSEAKIEGFSAPKKIFRTNREKLDANQANLADKTDLRKPAFKAYLSGQFGGSLRNRFSNRFGRFSPKTRPYSMPMIAMGLWWQPVRQNMTASLSREAPAYQMWRSDFARLPRVPLTLSGFARGVMREDIAALIRREL
ncbi:uncharacterized protein [Physcomitrium patens]|uniref:Uncharacterized protein n=1 Tax=Physcomitrium patens TaxID=3218 RepID=A0A2K1J1L0_PHYPA|nr:uncharacterized protein LOC112295100 [Physcomitrium patens]PNR35411.1 hypothetical protein PHYPA_023311 [Physcomitrium patens]|eukprot:XP_024402054.1 uncharacterized protein LOC112295100 [Physcomitrella patens]